MFHSSLLLQTMAFVHYLQYWEYLIILENYESNENLIKLSIKSDKFSTDLAYSVSQFHFEHNQKKI